MITPKKKIRAADGLYLEKIYDMLQTGSIVEKDEPVEPVSPVDGQEGQSQLSDTSTSEVAASSEPNTADEQTEEKPAKKIVTIEAGDEILTIPDFDEFSYTTAVGKVKENFYLYQEIIY